MKETNQRKVVEETWGRKVAVVEESGAWKVDGGRGRRVMFLKRKVTSGGR